MSTKEKLIKARVGMLALTEELKNISLACKRAAASPITVSFCRIALCRRSSRKNCSRVTPSRKRSIAAAASSMSAR
jgi:hypothetical protein